jgi:hypothetical protein
MRKYSLSVIVAIALLTGCEENDVRPPAVKVIVQGDIVYWKYADAWTFLTDDTGTTFDVQQLSNNGTTQLRASGNNSKFNLTILSVWKEEFNNQTYYAFFFRTFTDINRNHEFYLHEYEQVAQREPVGLLTLSISNFREPVKMNEAGIEFAAFNASIAKTSANPATSSYTGEMLLYSSPLDVLISSYRDGVPVYQFLKNASANTTSQLNFAEFKVAETILEPKETVSCGILAYPDGEDKLGYPIASNLQFDITNSTKPFSVGYPGIFSRYFTRILGDDESNFGNQLEKRGSPVASLEFPQLSYTVNNSDIGNFEMQISPNATHKHGYWIAKNTTWQVSSPGNNRSVIKTIPEPIRKKYKELDALSDLSLFRIKVYQHVGGNYYDWLDARFGPERWTAFEEYSFEKQVR